MEYIHVFAAQSPSVPLQMFRAAGSSSSLPQSWEASYIFAILTCAKEAGTAFPDAEIDSVGTFHLQRAFWVEVLR